MQTIAVIGLGYVGLPLVAAFGRHHPTIGFDLDESVVRQCQRGVDPSRELSPQAAPAMVEAVAHREFCEAGVHVWRL